MTFQSKARYSCVYQVLPCLVNPLLSCWPGDLTHSVKELIPYRHSAEQKLKICFEFDNVQALEGLNRLTKGLTLQLCTVKRPSVGERLAVPLQAALSILQVGSTSYLLFHSCPTFA